MAQPMAGEGVVATTSADEPRCCPVFAAHERGEKRAAFHVGQNKRRETALDQYCKYKSFTSGSHKC